MTIKGSVKDKDGGPLNFAQVKLVDGKGKVEETLTDNNGQFSFSVTQITPGMSVTITKDGYKVTKLRSLDQQPENLQAILELSKPLVTEVGSNNSVVNVVGLFMIAAGVYCISRFRYLSKDRLPLWK